VILQHHFVAWYKNSQESLHYVVDFHLGLDQPSSHDRPAMVFLCSDVILCFTNIIIKENVLDHCTYKKYSGQKNDAKTKSSHNSLHNKFQQGEFTNLFTGCKELSLGFLNF
jgi:hypothetical protein